MPIFPALLRCLLIAGAALTPLAAHAENAWPAERPITWLVGFAPGGSVDVITRAVAQQVGSMLKQSIVIENKAGATGALSLASASRAKPDGYTLVTAAGPILRQDKAADIGRGLTGVATLAEGAVVLVGPKGGPRDIGQLIALIKKDPSKFSFASSGVGSGQHIAGEMFNLALGAHMVHVPYKGGNQAVADLLGGQVPLAFLGVSTVLPQIQQGNLIAYAVTTPYRVDVLPDVPTFQEAGIRDFKLSQWYVAAVPDGTPPQVTAALRQAIEKALKSPEILRMLKASGINPPSQDAQDANAFASNSIRQAEQIATAAHMVLQ